MKNFKLDSLDDWKQVSVGELIAFDMPSSGYRSISFDVMAEDRVSVRAVSGDDAWLVAVGDGLISVKFTVQRPVGVLFMSDGDPDVFLRLATDTQVVPESRDPSFTSIVPRQAGPSQEVRQMMHIMRLNAERREASLRQEFERMRSELAATRAAREPDPDPVIEEESDADPA